MIQKLENLYLPDEKTSVTAVINKENTCDLSVIIPVYNMDKYIEQCILSATMQKTIYDIEIIVVDDGSFDKSPQIIAKLAAGDSRIITRRQKNSGLSAARNAGLNIATGRYVFFLDADDTIADGCFQDMLDKAYETGCDIVQCNFSNKVGQHMNKSGWKPEKTFVHDYEEMCMIPGYAMMKVIRRELFNDVRFPENYWYEDTIMHMQIFQKCKNGIYIIDKPYYVYFKNPCGITQSKRRSLRPLETVYVLEKIMKGMSEPEKKAVYNEVLRHLTSISYHRIKVMKRKYKRSAFKKMCDIVISLGMNTTDEGLKEYEKIFYKRNYVKYILTGVMRRW